MARKTADSLMASLQPNQQAAPTIDNPQPAPSDNLAPPEVDFSDVLNKKPNKGGLPIGLIANIQKTYQQPQQSSKDDTPAKVTPNKPLGGGWDGGGR